MLSLLAAILGTASAPCPKDEPIKVVVLAILATDKNETVHERLAEIAAEIRKKDPQLTGFDLHATCSKSLKIGESAHFDLIDNARVEISVNERTDEEGRITISVKPPKLNEITYACTCGKFVPIITNYYTADKQRLIIAVMTKPCRKKP